MKMPCFIRRLAVVSMLGVSAALTPAITLPETNALISEVEIGAPTALVEGQFGQLIAARSNLVVIGYRTTLESNPSSPLAAVYRKSAVLGNFDFQGELRVPGVPGATNLSVWDLATDGKRIGISGHINANENGVNGSPVIYLFAHDGTQWSLETTLVPSESLDSFAMSENLIVAGATALLGEGSGKVLVFEKTNGAWEETIILPPADSPVKNGFGRDVAAQGGNILVGAPGSYSREDEGHAYIYSRVDGAWRLQADLVPGGFPTYWIFGGHVAIDGDTALVSYYSGRFLSGNVHVFERSDLGWSRVGGLQGWQDKETNFGLVLAMSGKNTVVGASREWSESNESAYLFRKNGAVFDRLRIEPEPTSHHEEYPDYEFGAAVAVDDNTVYVGAPLYDGSVTNQGVVYVFEFEFPVQLHSSWARHSDNSFHFAATELKVGTTYTIETCSSFETEWTFVKQFTAYAADMELDVGLYAGTGSWFFRILQN